MNMSGKNRSGLEEWTGAKRRTSFGRDEIGLLELSERDIFYRTKEKSQRTSTKVMKQNEASGTKGIDE